MKKIILLVALATSIATTSFAQERQRKNVDAVEGQLRLHPDSIAITIDSVTLSFFLDKVNRTLYMTANTAIYSKFAKWLPEEKIAGQEKVVNMEGTFIDPFTLFSREQLRQVEARLKKFGLDLNNYKVARLFNYQVERVGTMRTTTTATSGVNSVQQTTTSQPVVKKENRYKFNL